MAYHRPHLKDKGKRIKDENWKTGLTAPTIAAQPGHGALPSFRSPLMLHPCFNALVTGDARMKIEPNGRGGDIDEGFAIV